MRKVETGLTLQTEQPNPALDLSIILPALVANLEYLRCIYALRAALSGRILYEIISVVKEVESFADLESPDLRILPEDTPGIYAAMNTGLNHARGKYVYFIGQDDILLPEAVEAVKRGLWKQADVILANVFWGKGRMYKNSSSPRSLIWRNWCHQGIMYRRELLRKAAIHFPEVFITQADHYVNIVLTAGYRATILKHDSYIAWYSASGVSTKIVDNAFRIQFPSLIHEYFGFLPFVTVVLRRTLVAIARKVLHR
jgi:glycosyltransferase involved in cell wall biosynthesis